MANDRSVLSVFYGINGGPGWLPWTRAQWRTSKDLSHWSGVTVNANGRVVKLDLSAGLFSDGSESSNLIGERLQHDMVQSCRSYFYCRPLPWPLYLADDSSGRVEDHQEFYSSLWKVTTNLFRTRMNGMP